MKHIRNISGVKINRLVSTLMSNHDSEANNGQPFKLKSSSEFAVRSHDVFEGLESLEKEHHEKNLEDKNDLLPAKESDELIIHSTIDFTDCFKKPLSVAPRRRRHDETHRSIPDYVKHPKKWTKYSLADVPEHTDEANNRAAMEFLKGLQPQQKQGIDSSAKIAFNRSVSKAETTKSKSRSKRDKKRSKFLSSGTGSVVMMTECVVGQKKRAHSKRHTSESTEKSNTEVSLPHLQDETEDNA